METLNTSEKITLCRQGSKCCPTVEREEDGYVINDDFGGKVTLTKDQMLLLGDAVDVLIKE